MTKQTERVFIPYDGCCPFQRDNRCKCNCVFFIELAESGHCRMDGANSGRTGYFIEQEKQPYGNYY